MVDFNNMNNIVLLNYWFKDFHAFKTIAAKDTTLTHSLDDVLYARMSKLAQNTLINPEFQKHLKALKPLKEIEVRSLSPEATELITKANTVFKEMLAEPKPSEPHLQGSPFQESFFLEKVRKMEIVLNDPLNISSPTAIREHNREFKDFLNQELKKEEIALDGGQAQLRLSPYAALLLPTDAALLPDDSAPTNIPSYPSQFYNDYLATPRAQVFQHSFPGKDPLTCQTIENGEQLTSLAQTFTSSIRSAKLSDPQCKKLDDALLFALSQQTGNSMLSPYIQKLAGLSRSFSESKDLEFKTTLSHAHYSISQAKDIKDIPISNAFKITINAQADSRYQLKWSDPELLTREINSIRDEFGIGSAAKGELTGSYEVHMDAEGSLSIKNVSANYSITLTKSH